MTDETFRNRLRSEILDRARLIVTSEGLPALQARRVAREANCSVGSLYNVFGDIDGLIIALNVETVGELEKDLAASFLATATKATQQRLLDLAFAYTHFALAHQNRWKAIFEHRLPADRDVPNNYRADQARLLALIEKIISDEISSEALRVRAARALFGAVHGIIALSIDNKLEAFNEATLREEIRFIVKAAANGLTAAS